MGTEKTKKNGPAESSYGSSFKLQKVHQVQLYDTMLQNLKWNKYDVSADSVLGKWVEAWFVFICTL